MVKITIKSFTKKELNIWLRVHSKWNHQEWYSLIEELSTQGCHEWTDTEQGRNEIGFYLENKQR